jgi:membrane protease YdiL (CAAX protease family)
MAVVFIRLWKGKDFFGGMWKTEKRMTHGAFWQLLCVFISAQLVFQICAPIQEMMLNLIGLSAMEAMEAATVNSDTISMFLYLSLGAPVVEEIIFRGLVMRGVEKYGKRLAIWVSAIAFGLFHGNIVQSPYAFVVGLVLGYVAMEYNILWAMVLHMVNNLVLGDTLPRLTQWMGKEASNLVVFAVILVCSIVAVVSLIRNRKQVLEYHRQTLWNWEGWSAYCASAGFIALFVLMELNAVSMLFL